MAETVVTAILSFISTNLDDIFVLMFLFAQADNKEHRRAVVIGQGIGLTVLFAVSGLGALGLARIPPRYLGLLGIVPIALGIGAWFSQRKAEDGGNEESTRKAERGAFGVALLVIANGADNIGVYIPLFTGYTCGQFALTAGIFAIMMAVWCILGKRLADLPHVKAAMRKHKRILVPLVLVGLGICIIATHMTA